MTTYVIHNSGVPVSIGTVVADPLPDGLTAVELSDVDAERLSSGTGRWDTATLSVVNVPAELPDDALLTVTDTRDTSRLRSTP